MKRTVLPAILLLSILLAPGGKTPLAETKLPEVGGRTALANVNGETIFLDDLLEELSAIHEGAGDDAGVTRPAASALLDRIVNARLVVQEARNIGLDDLPEVKRAFETYELDALRAMLFGDRVRNLRKPDRKEVDRRYREAVKEVKVVSILVEKEADAKRLEAKVKAGGDFAKILKKMIDEGAGTGSAEGEYFKFRNLLPQVGAALASLKTGQVTPLLKIGEKYTMVKLLGVRFPEDPEARKTAERETLEAKRTAVLKSYAEGLTKKYAKIDEKLLNGLDYDSPKPGFEKFLKDTRVVAEVQGEKPVTVKDLSESLQKKFFHGTEGAAQRNRINRRKAQVLEGILFKRVTDKEARRLKIDRRPAYREKVEQNRRGILFGVFVQKVIEPEIRLTEGELKAHMKSHIDEYTSPEMMRIESIAFSEKETALKAAELLRKGSDFQWTRANAEGRIDPGKAADVLPFGKGLLMTKGLPEEVKNAVAGAAGGEYRLYFPPKGPFYVLLVREVIPPSPQPFDTVREQLAKQVFERKRAEALEEYVKRLKSASDVKLFATGRELLHVLQEPGR